MDRDGLMADSYCTWINNNITIDSKIKIIYEEFVVGTPSHGLSRKGRSLYDYYFYKEPESYNALLQELLNGIDDIEFSDTYGKLKSKINNHRWIGFLEFPNDVEEAVYIYVGSDVKNDSLYKERFADRISAGTKGKRREEIVHDAEKKLKIVQTNKIFYHIRNGLAHGSYAIYEKEEDSYFIIQDENKTHFISARIILKQSRLINWISILANRRESITACSVQNIEEAK